jgi:hypothetical protein
MDRTGQRHMAPRADNCNLNLEGKLPACSAVIAISPGMSFTPN